MKKNVSKRHIRKGDICFKVVNYSFFLLFTFLCAYPFYYLIINSVSSNELSNNGLINFWPRQIHFQNYKDVFELRGLSGAMVVSVARTVIGTACTVMASAYLGFMFTQKRMWRRRFFYRVIVITMY